MAKVTKDRLTKMVAKNNEKKNGKAFPPKKGGVGKKPAGKGKKAPPARAPKESGEDMPMSPETTGSIKGHMSSYEKEREDEKKEHGGFEKYKVEEWARAMKTAGEIVADPKKMAAVAKILDKEEMAITSVRKIREMAKRYDMDE